MEETRSNPRQTLEEDLVIAGVGLAIVFIGSLVAGEGMCNTNSGGCTGPHPLVGTIIFFIGAVVILAALCVALLNVALYLTAKGRRRTTEDLALTQAATVGTVLKEIAERVAAGETVAFRPSGNSMVPLIHSGDEVIVAPVDPTLVEVGDIVLTKVAGSVYIHLVKAIQPAKRRVQIGNN